MKEEFFLEIKPYETARNLILDFTSKQMESKSAGDVYIFRGHSKSEYELIPNILRLNTINKINFTLTDTNNNKHCLHSDISEYWQMNYEFALLKSFSLMCDKQGLEVPFHSYENPMKDWSRIENEKWIPERYWELAALAQHYGMPTRLLDWTYNLLTALFFAASGVTRKQIKYNDNIVIWSLNTSFINKIDKERKSPIITIHPPYNGNANLNAQQGILTLWQDVVPTKDSEIKVNRSPLEVRLREYLKDFKYEGEPVLKKITLPYSQVPYLINYLYNMNYYEARLFPGYEGVVETLIYSNADYYDKIN